MSSGTISEVDVREAGQSGGGGGGREGFSGNGCVLAAPILGYPRGVNPSTLFFSWSKLCNDKNISGSRSNGSKPKRG